MDKTLPPLSIGLLPGALQAALVEGLDPRRDAANEERRSRLRDLLTAYGVVCIRLQRALTAAEFYTLGSMLGLVKDPVGRGRDGARLRYSEQRQTIDAGFVLTDEMRRARGGTSVGGDEVRPGLFEFFHTDDSFVECPAAATILHARALPPSGGGDTCFIDMRGAFRLLPHADQARLVGLRAVHSYNNRGAFPPRASASGPLEALVDVSHPIVRAHPISGEAALYFDLDRATHVEGLPTAEGRALLQSLQDHAEGNAPRYDHRWQSHDVLVWDNASVQHRASGDFPVGEPRRFWRHLIEGQKPVGFAQALPEL
jgi:alpha-ketoglutarate-dependent taurine dioxygenase